MRLLHSFYALVALGGLRTFAAPSLQERSLGDAANEIGERDWISSLASTILHDIENAAECDACDGILYALKGLAALGDHIFIEVITEVCILSKAEDSDVCTGTIAAEGPLLARDVRGLSVGSHTSQLFCGTIFGLCPVPAVQPYTISFPQPKPSTPRPSTSGKTPIQVVHISDTHVDLSYETGASWNCTKPICCRPYTSADAPGNNAYPAGPYGEHTCDPPLSLEQSMFAAIENLNPAFTIFTGDVAAHDIWLVDQTEVETDLNTTYSDMTSLKVVYPALGNHDTAPVNAFPPRAISSDGQWAYDTMAADWTTWIGPTAAQSVESTGSYSVKYPNSPIRIISFNSIFYYTLNFWLYSDPLESDPSGQFAWLVSELQAAETAGERVWLISHIPSGSADFFHDYSNYFNQIVNRYEATIAALFYGHTHRDEFMLAYSDYSSQTFDTAIAMSYIAPSMTPTSGSPSFRVYEVDPDTGAVLDFTQYIANISDPSYQSNPVWIKYYSAKETYGALLSPPLTDPNAELTPAFWHNVTTVFEGSDGAFNDYYARKTRGYDPYGTCTGSCKSDTICQLRAAESQYNCAIVSPGINFSKRSEGHEGHSEECEGTRIRSIFRVIAGDREAFVGRMNEEVARRKA